VDANNKGEKVTALEEVNKKLLDCPKTVFDDIDLKIDLKKIGGALRDELAQLTNLYGRINQLASNAILLKEEAEKRLEKIEAVAWSSLDQSIKVTDKKKIVKDVKVKIDEEITTINEQECSLVLYSYVAQRGRDKVKEISAILDVGRTLLSWDKEEQRRM